MIGRFVSLELDVLIVEDDDMLNQVMCLQLKLAGCSVRSATGGREALKMIMERKPSVLILDVGLPDISGEEVVAELRKNSLTCSLPLIVHTTLDLSIDQEKQLKLGPSRFVTKATAFSDKLAELVTELAEESKTDLNR